MAISLPPLDKKGRNALIIAVVVMALVVAYWYFLWSPDHVEVKGIAAHADTLDARNAKDSVDIANGLEGKLRADGERYSNELSGLRRLVPTVNQVPALLNSISTDARQVGLEVSEFAQDGVFPGDDFDMIKYKFGVIGPFHKIAEFLTTVASSPRIIAPINVQITAPSRVIERKPRADETFVEVKFGVVTYVAKTRPTSLTVAPMPTAAKPGAK